MEISEHDQKILDGMETRLKELTGQEATHVFIDTEETINIGHDSNLISDCRCHTPLIYSALETKCKRCNKAV